MSVSGVWCRGSGMSLALNVRYAVDIMIKREKCFTKLFPIGLYRISSNQKKRKKEKGFS